MSRGAESQYRHNLLAAGRLLARTRFEAFGARRESGAIVETARETNPRGFTGQEELDSLNLIHLIGRVYDPRLGRFLSVDPVFEFPSNPQSLNPYSYVLNNPLSLSDPSGYAACDTGHSQSTAACDPMTGSHIRGVDTGAKCSGHCSISFSGNGAEHRQGAADAQHKPKDSAEIGSTQTLGKTLLPVTAQLGERGIQGTMSDNFVGAVEELLNLLKGSLLGALTAGAPEHDPDLAAQLAPDPIADKQLLGASVMELMLAVAPVIRGEELESLATKSGPIRWSPLNGPGPVGSDVAASFRGGSYTESVTSEATTLYRAYGGEAGKLGRYWTRTPPAGPLQATIDSALNPAWGNTANNVVRIQVPAGTRIYEGFAAPQGGLIGGGSQVYIPKVDPRWIVNP